jgi:tetratricopeptide (TPR) repeat protein
MEKPLSRLDRLDLWIDAVNRHEFGSPDPAVETVNAWSGSDLRTLWIDINSIVTLVRDRKMRQFFMPVDRELRWTQQGWVTAQNRMVQVFYTGRELTHLLEIANSFGEPTSGRENLLLKRGAALHADVAMLASTTSRPAGRATSGTQRYRLNMNDGQATGLDVEVDHWNMGRRLLDLISVRDGENRLGPKADEAVRFWYVASCAYLISVGDLDPAHFAKGLDLFPKDADVLFMNGVLHETIAGARRQSALQKASHPAGITFAYRSRGGELSDAEDAFRRALETAPQFAEARMHYGRVLGQRGQHKNALAELQKAAAAVEGPWMQYYAALFLAGELEAVGNNDEAIRAYERAAALFPGAQSPRLALSRLASGANRAPAREAFLTLAAEPVAAGAREDPWWVYDLSGGRAADLVFSKLHEMLRSGGR